MGSRPLPVVASGYKDDAVQRTWASIIFEIKPGGLGKGEEKG